MTAGDVVDSILEVPVVTSFTRLGYAVRRRIDDWRPLWDYDLRGRTVAITGPTSGIGEAAARWYARLGADLVLIARNEEKLTGLAAGLEEETGNTMIATVVADMGDLDAVRAAGDRIAELHNRVDVLVHNAGALLRERQVQPDGTESTVASQVIGPFLLTGLLLDRLTPGGRVLTMSSGGMYAVPLTVSGLEMDADSYRGATQYALAKRAQVTLNEMWAEKVPSVHFHALHPGWAETPGVAGSLPGFRRVVGPLLRSANEAADTLVWLSADDGPPLATSGDFWLDRRTRSIHRLARTRESDTPERRAALWDLVAAKAGWDLP